MRQLTKNRPKLNLPAGVSAAKNRQHKKGGLVVYGKLGTKSGARYVLMGLTELPKPGDVVNAFPYTDWQTRVVLQERDWLSVRVDSVGGDENRVFMHLF